MTNSTENTEKKLKRDNELNDLKHVMGSEPGRRFIWAHLSAAQVFHDPFTMNHSVTCHNLGKKTIGLKLFNNVTLFPELYMKMMKENRNNEEN